jgi:hypothetical protein
MIGEGGTEYELKMAERIGAKRIVGSGNTWHSKLDLKGIIARWSLKFTSKKSFVVTEDTIDEAVHACEGPGGDGSVPLWLFGTPKHDMVMLRLNDFEMMQETEVELIKVESNKSEQKKKRASVPQLFRGE